MHHGAAQLAVGDREVDHRSARVRQPVLPPRERETRAGSASGAPSIVHSSDANPLWCETTTSGPADAATADASWAQAASRAASRRSPPGIGTVAGSTAHASKNAENRRRAS